MKITGKWGRKSALLHRLFIFMNCWKNILMSLWRQNKNVQLQALITQPRLVLADEPQGSRFQGCNALLDVFGEINRQGQTILMVLTAPRQLAGIQVLFIKDGEVFHQIYRGEKTKEEMYQMISDTLTILMTGGEYHA